MVPQPPSAQFQRPMTAQIGQIPSKPTVVDKALPSKIPTVTAVMNTADEQCEYGSEEVN